MSEQEKLDEVNSVSENPTIEKTNEQDAEIISPSEKNETKSNPSDWIRNHKPLCLLILLLIVGFLIFVDTYCNHDWTEATCTEPRICSKCGKTDGEPLGHDWQDATCTNPETCSRCGETQGEPLGHDVSSWVVDEEPTCSNEGSRHGVCKRCGQTITEPIDRLPHTDGEWTVTEPSVIDRNGTIQDGTESLVCSVCGEVIETRPYKIEATKGQCQAVAAVYQEVDTLIWGGKDKIYEALVVYDHWNADDVEFALDHAVIDWNEVCYRFAKDLLRYSPESRESLTYELTTYDGFTAEQAAYACDKLDL